MISLTLINIPSQKATMSSSFTPILGQYGVNIREFCNVFNINTKFITEELPINLTILAESKDKFRLEKIKVSPNFLVNFILKLQKNKTLSLKLIYMLFTIDLKFEKEVSKNLKAKFKIKLAYIKSFGIKIVD